MMCEYERYEYDVILLRFLSFNDRSGGMRRAALDETSGDGGVSASSAVPSSSSWWEAGGGDGDTRQPANSRDEEALDAGARCESAPPDADAPCCESLPLKENLRELRLSRRDRRKKDWDDNQKELCASMRSLVRKLKRVEKAGAELSAASSGSVLLTNVCHDESRAAVSKISTLASRFFLAAATDVRAAGGGGGAASGGHAAPRSLTRGRSAGAGAGGTICAA